MYLQGVDSLDESAILEEWMEGIDYDHLGCGLWNCLMWRLRQSVGDDQRAADDQVECIEPENWMIRSWVAAVEAAVVVVVVYVCRRDTVGSGEWLFCRTEMVEVPVVQWMAGCIRSAMAGYKC